MNKKTYVALLVLNILLYAAIIISQTGVLGLGELFGHIFYVMLVAGIISSIWLLVKRPKKEGN